MNDNDDDIINTYKDDEHQVMTMKATTITSTTTTATSASQYESVIPLLVSSNIKKISKALDDHNLPIDPHWAYSPGAPSLPTQRFI